MTIIQYVMLFVQASFCVGSLILWTRWDDLHSIAKEVQNSRDPYILNGFKYENRDSRREMRHKAREWVTADAEYAWWWGLRSILRGLGLSAVIFLITLAVMWLNAFFSIVDGAASVTYIAAKLGVAMLDAASFDLIFLAGGQGEYPATSIFERISVFIFLLSGILIVAAIIGYVLQTIVSYVAVRLFPIHTYWAATDSRDGGRRGIAEKALRFALDFYK